MSQHRTPEVSEAEIAVHWQEENYVNPPEKFVAQANLTDKTVLERFSLDKFPDCFAVPVRERFATTLFTLPALSL